MDYSVGRRLPPKPESPSKSGSVHRRPRSSNYTKQAIATLDRLVRHFNERHVETRPSAYFGTLLRNARSVQLPAIDLDADLAAGWITDDEWEELIGLDVIVRGESRADGRTMLIGVQIRNEVRAQDIARVRRRVEILRLLGHTAIPAVCGERIAPAASKSAESAGVLVRIFLPE